MTEERFDEIIKTIYVNFEAQPDYQKAYKELLEFAKPHLTKPKLYQARVEIPEPVRDARLMEYAKTYYIPDVGNENRFRTCGWMGSDSGARFLERGLIYLTKENAIKRAEAMLVVEYAE